MPDNPFLAMPPDRREQMRQGLNGALQSGQIKDGRDIAAIAGMMKQLAEIDQPESTFAEPPGMLREAAAFPQRINIGAAKVAVGKTGLGIAKLIGSVPKETTTADIGMEPEGTGEKVGGFAEQAAEFFLPAGKIAQGAKLLEGALAAGKISGPVAIAGKMLLEGAGAGAVGTAQTGSVKEGAQVGVLGAGASGVAQSVGAAAKRLTPGVKRAWNATEQAAVDFLEANGVKLSFGQKAGVEGVRRIEQGMINTPGSMSTAQKFFEGQEGQVATAARKTLSDVSPAGQAETAEAGKSLLNRLEARISQAKEYADKRYGQVRKTAGRNVDVIEQPVKLVEHQRPDGTAWTEYVKPGAKTYETATDITASQANLRPIYEELAQAMPEFQRQSSPGFTALRQIVDGPGMVDALTADRNLGAVKALLRESGGASKYLNSQSQRLATMTIQQLSKDFETALGKAGGGALLKLQQGRSAVKRYHDVAELLGSFPKNAAGELEPAGVYGRLMGGGDKNIELLGTLKHLAPNEVRQLGHTFFEGMLDKATREGGFGRAPGLVADWNRLGPATKRMMFGNEGTEAVNKLLLAAKLVTRDLNPSGSAKSLAVLTPLANLGAVGAALGTVLYGAPVGLAVAGATYGATKVASSAYTNKKLAELLLTKQGGKLLNQGLTLPVNSPPWIKARASLNALYSQMSEDSE